MPSSRIHEFKDYMEYDHAELIINSSVKMFEDMSTMDREKICKFMSFVIDNAHILSQNFVRAIISVFNCGNVADQWLSVSKDGDVERFAKIITALEDTQYNNHMFYREFINVGMYEYVESRLGRSDIYCIVKFTASIDNALKYVKNHLSEISKYPNIMSLFKELRSISHTRDVKYYDWLSVNASVSSDKCREFTCLSFLDKNGYTGMDLSVELKGDRLLTFYIMSNKLDKAQELLDLSDTDPDILEFKWNIGINSTRDIMKDEDVRLVADFVIKNNIEDLIPHIYTKNIQMRMSKYINADLMPKVA